MFFLIKRMLNMPLQSRAYIKWNRDSCGHCQSNQSTLASNKCSHANRDWRKGFSTLHITQSAILGSAGWPMDQHHIQHYLREARDSPG